MSDGTPGDGFESGEGNSFELNKLLYSKGDMLNFASFWYGVEIGLLGDDDQRRCKDLEGAFEYWIETVKG